MLRLINSDHTISVTFNGPASNVILLIAGKLMCKLHTLVTIVMNTIICYSAY